MQDRTIHELDGCTMRPLIGAPGARGRTWPMATRCLLVEHAGGWLLIDAGIGAADLAAPGVRLGRSWLWTCRPTLDPASTVLAQLDGLGIDAAAVTDIALTHLDLDHVGGASDFPSARVHVASSELAAAQGPARRDPIRRSRYRPAQLDGLTWEPYESAGEGDGAGARWRGVAGAVRLRGIEPAVWLVPLPGHSRGHSGYAVALSGGAADHRWLLHAGSSYTRPEQLLDPPPTGVPSRWHRWFERAIADDDGARVSSLAMLRRIARDDRVTVVQSHPGLGEMRGM